MRLSPAAASGIALILVNVLLVSSTPSAFSSFFSAQPPVDTSIYRSTTLGGPTRFDPARAYDSGAARIIQNVYEGLIFFGDKPLAPQADAEITDEYVADLTVFVPVLATKVPSMAGGDISPDGKNWTFNINTNAVFQPWTNRLLHYEPERNVTVADVVYSFQRQMVYGSPYAPTWTWFEAAFGIEGWSTEAVKGPFSTYDNGTFKNPEDEIAAASMIQSWIYPGPGANQVTFHFEKAWPENMLKQNFAMTWGSVLNKDWVIEHGGWDGKFTPGWTNYYHWKPTKTRSELDEWKDPAVYGEKGSNYPSVDPDIPDMCGTGPYRLTESSPANASSSNWSWRLDKFTDYWRGWAGNHVSTVIMQNYVWNDARDKFLSGELDDCLPYGTQMKDLLNSSDPSGHTPVSGVRLYWNLPGLHTESLLFSFNVSLDSPYVPKNGTTPAPNLFADVHIRRAFAHALNFTQCIEDYASSSGDKAEVLQRASWWLRGMSPDYENKTLIPRDINTTIIEEELKAAGVWEQGFETAIVYTIGSNVERYLVMERSIAAVLASINPKFNVSAISLDWPNYLNYSDKNYLPVFAFGWMADFADPGDLARIYMHSNGTIPSLQKYNDSYIDYLVDLGLSQPDGSERNATYQELQYIYWRDVPSLPLFQSTSYRLSRDWVRGWYYNPLYYGFYYYDIYKEGASEGGSGGQAFDYKIPLIVAGTVIAVVAVGSVIYFRRRKRELPPTAKEPSTL